MSETATSSAILCIVVLVSSLGLVGCADASGAELLGAATGGLAGSWSYLVTNAFSATFTGCTGDATVLEGATYSEANALLPTCVIAVQFDVTQDGDTFQVVPHAVTCSDSSPATATGQGQVIGSGVAGQWQTTSAGGLTAIQDFTGLITGSTVALLETQRTFSGTLQGACSLSPSLGATVTIE